MLRDVPRHWNGGAVAAKRKRLASNAGIRCLLLVASFMLMGCEPSVPGHSQFQIGMTRGEVLDKFGEPKQTQSFTKTGQPIWGPIEDYWPQVPMGATVEIWSYDSRIEMTADDNSFEQAGRTQLYFIGNSDEVDGIGFHVKGAVYEGS